MSKISLLIGGVFALALFYLYRKTRKVETDERLVGNVLNPRALGDALSGFLTPPSATDKAPVGPPRIDLGVLNRFPVEPKTPVQYTPPSPPTNNVQITPSFKIPSFLSNFSGGGQKANEPTKPPASTLLKSAGIVQKLSAKPPSNTPVSSLTAAKSSGFLSLGPKPASPTTPTLFRKLT